MVLLLLTLNALGTLFWYFHCWFPNASCNISHKLLRPSQFQDKFMEILEWFPTSLLTVSAHWKSGPVNLTVLGVCQMVLWLIMSLLDKFYFQKKIEVSKLIRNIMDFFFFFFTEDVLSTQFVAFLHAILKKHKQVSALFLFYALLKLLENYLIDSLLFVKEYWTSMKYNTFMIPSFFSVHQSCNFL